MTIVSRLVQEFTRNNKDLVEWTEQMFGQLLWKDPLRWQFFNTLSYMEHIGSSKIMATQKRRIIDYATLKHLHEETGHAVLFKRQAERCCNEKLGYEQSALIAPAYARSYFSALEVSMIRYFGSQANYRTIYLYMSLVVEFRAVWAYEILDRCITEAECDFSLKKLLAEEQGHLNSMVRRLAADGQYSPKHIEFFWKRERWLYVRLMRAIEGRMSREPVKFAISTESGSDARMVGV